MPNDNSYPISLTDLVDAAGDNAPETPAPTRSEQHARTMPTQAVQPPAPDGTNLAGGAKSVPSEGGHPPPESQTSDSPAEAQSGTQKTPSVKSLISEAMAARLAESGVPADKLSALPPEALRDLAVELLGDALPSLKRRVKVDGEEIEIPIAEMEKDYQLKRASYKRLQEAAAEKKSIEQLIRFVRENPRQALADPRLGVDLRKLAEEVLNDAIEDEMLSPEAKELKSLKAKMAAEETAKRRAAEEQHRTAVAELTKTTQQNYMKEISAALQQNNLPVTEFTIARAARYLLGAHEANHPMTATDVMSLVKQDYQSEISQFFKPAPAEVVASMLGDDVLAKIRAHEIAKVKPAPVTAPEVPAKEKAAKKKPRWDEKWAELQKEYGDFDF